ncbi:DUF2339 domain-containing protein [Labrys wisconsinensis]|uniref:Membrane protein n=1 Tax=Labrys wisconsinensis TaxID=425677 RepID=A0ABU0JAE8_9HYPH|nr:DUF2339 domain-containing protein [Labrys wisconsinensis]MDQ0470521.1 putative membrane protein [Labrys wisconsinensis]
MDDLAGWIILGAIVVLGLPILAISAFIMALGLRGRVGVLEHRLAELQHELRQRAAGAPAAAAAPPEAPEMPLPRQAEPEVPAPEPEPEPAPAEPAVAESPPEAPVFAGEPVLPPPPAARPPGLPRPSLEERLGARWAVWVGGLALAFGGIFLVQYSIEAGLLGPEARITLGLLFSLVLIAVGEWLRRRPAPAAEAGRAVYIPGVVTAAGTAALFATVYAAHALYGLIGPGAAFAALGLVALLTMAAAALHGPWLAGLGLVGAYATPLLVSSRTPDPWALVIYLAVVTAAAFALARLRLWRWLAVTAILAALGWGLAILGATADGSLAGGDVTPAAAYVLALGGLIVGLLVVQPHRGHTGFSGFDGVALTALAGLAALALVLAHAGHFAGLGLGTALVVAAALLASALAFDGVTPAAGIAALLAVGLVLTWPVAEQVAAEPITIVPHRLVSPPLIPDALAAYLATAAVAGLALFAATTAALFRRAVPLRPAIALALAGVAGPLLILACAYVRATGFAQSIPYGLVALAAAAVLAGTTDRLMRPAAPGSDAAASLHAAGATAALALALAMTLEGSPLTLAFALASLGTAWVAAQRPLAALRWSAAALAVLVLARIGGAWTVIGEAMTTFPDWSDIALRYAVPALALGFGGRLLRRQATDTPAAILEGAAIVLGTTAAALAIRLVVVGPEAALAAPLGLMEGGLDTALAFGMALGFARGALTTTSPVHRFVAPLAALGAVALAVVGPVLALNPAIRGEDVVGGILVNTLLLGYAFPAVLAVLAARMWRRIAGGEGAAADRTRPLAHPLAVVLGATGLVLAFLYVTFETRVAVSGPDMSFASISNAESYAYSAVWLVFGIMLLAAGLVFNWRGARLGSALVILLTVAKVFLIDMDALEGVWRALSFIGLGAVLIGIGLVYQRLLFGAGRRSTAGGEGGPA